MEIDAKKIKALCALDDREFAKVLESVAISAGSDPATVKNIVKNAPGIKRMLAPRTLHTTTHTANVSRMAMIKPIPPMEVGLVIMGQAVDSSAIISA